MNKLDLQVEQSIKIITAQNTSVSGLIIAGQAGVGKSTIVYDTLKKLEKPYITISGKITPLGLYQTLSKYHNKIVVLDDAEIEQSSTVFNFLKAILGKDKDNKPIRASYADKNGEISFKFEGSLIIITNDLSGKKHEKHLKAVLDRILFVKYELTKEQILEKMLYIVNNCHYKSIDIMYRRIIFNLIKENYAQINDMSLRTLIRCYDAYLTLGDNWLNYCIEVIFGLEIEKKDIDNQKIAWYN